MDTQLELNNLPKPVHPRTQRENIKALFLARKNQWIPLPCIMPYAAQYNTRILELRRSGMNIINRTKEVNGIKHSWYMYEDTNG